MIDKRQTTVQLLNSMLSVRGPSAFLWFSAN